MTRRRDSSWHSATFLYSRSVQIMSRISRPHSLAPPLPHRAIGILHVASERGNIVHGGQSEAVAQRRAQELKAAGGIRISGQGDGLRDVMFKVRSDEFRQARLAQQRGADPRGPAVAGKAEHRD